MPQKPPQKQTPKRRRTDSGWTITPRTLGVTLTAVALAAAFWKPIEVFGKLSHSIDNLSVAVVQLQTIMKEQGDDITVMKAKLVGLEAVKLQRDTELSLLNSRVQALEARLR